MPRASPAKPFAMVQGAEKLRKILQEELVRRCSKNRNYSIRAFARYLGVQAPTLSHVIRGKRTPSKQFAQKVCDRLSLKFDFAGDTLDFQTLDASYEDVISDWYHFAILELILIDQFKADAKWIAKTLDITVGEVSIALERMERMDLISRKNGRIQPVKMHNTTVGTAKTTFALRKIQAQFLELASAAMDEVEPDLRDQSGLTIAINRADLPEVTEQIKKFRRELCAFLERNKKRTDVYQLTISFFPLTKRKKAPTPW
jgi:transcriptional regulator with XRE-family HTH domain